MGDLEDANLRNFRVENKLKSLTEIGASTNAKHKKNNADTSRISAAVPVSQALLVPAETFRKNSSVEVKNF